MNKDFLQLLSGKHHYKGFQKKEKIQILEKKNLDICHQTFLKNCYEIRDVIALCYCPTEVQHLTKLSMLYQSHDFNFVRDSKSIPLMVMIR